MIALLAESFPPVVGGAETVSSRLARAWAESGRDVVVFADSRGMSGEEEFDKKQQFAVRRFAGPRPFRRWRKFRALAEFAAEHPDAAVFADSWRSVPRALPERHPVFCLAHGNDMLALRPKKEARRQRALARANFIAANSNFTADLAREVAPASAQVRVISPGADLSEPPDAAKDKFNRRQVAKLTKNAAPLLATVARLEPRKGMDAVIRALPGLKSAHPKIAYLIVGEGGDKERLEKLAKELGVGDRVHLAGHLSAPKRFAALASSSLFALTCRRSEHSVEGFGAAILEAALCGVPALAAHAGGAPEAALDGETGWLCDGEDDEKIAQALKDALADEKELAKRGAAAQKRAEAEFTWKHAAQKHLEWMDEARAAS